MLLGEIVTWDLRSLEVSYTDVLQALTDAGLDPAAAKEMAPRSAFGRACKELKENRSIDKVSHARGEISFQLTKKEIRDDRVDFDYECRIVLNTETGDLKCDENPVIEQTARDLFAHAMQTRNAADVTRLVQKMFSDHADLYPINPHKGVAYFVPDAHRDFTAKIESFLTKLGGTLPRFPVPKGTIEGNASVRDAVNAGLETVLGELRESVDGFDAETRKSTMEKALEKFEVMRHKVECYGEYLDTKKDALLAELSAAKAALVEKLTAVDEPAKVAA
jgi:hypothetical protein